VDPFSDSNEERKSLDMKIDQKLQSEEDDDDSVEELNGNFF